MGGAQIPTTTPDPSHGPLALSSGACELIGVNDDSAGQSPAEPEAPSAGESPEQQMLDAREALENELEKVRKEAEDTQAKWLRAAADLENYKKRAVRERDEALRFGQERLLKDFLPVIDDLDRAIDMVRQADGKVVEGFEMVRRKFLSQMEKHGVSSFDSEGETFDPNRHEAVQQTHSPDVPSHKVLTELQRGFLLNDRLLRPAMVVVSLGPESGEGGGDPGAEQA